MDYKPLKDITILDLTWVIAGPAGTKILMDLGANIIKVETRNTFDVLRSGWKRIGNSDPYAESGWEHNNLNLGKKNISINLKSADGRMVLEELVRRVDIVACNFGVAAFKKLKLTYDDLRKINPGIIVMNASGLGDYGPYCSFLSFAPVLQALTGIESIIGYERDAPYGKYSPVADFMGSLAVCNFLLAAIAYRKKTGEGQFIDLSQEEAATSYLGHLLLDYQVNGRTYGPIGNRHYADSAAPHNAYPCLGEDRWCVICAATEAEWRRLAAALTPDGRLLFDPRFCTLSDRIGHLSELDREISKITVTRDAEELCEELQACGVSAAPVQSSTDMLFRDKHLNERHAFRRIVFPPSERKPEAFLVNTEPFFYNAKRDHEDHEPAYAVGKHTEQIVTGMLGFSREWYLKAVDSGAFS